MALASKILSILPMGIWEFFEPIDYYFLLDSLVNLLATLRFTTETCRFRFINLISKILKIILHQYLFRYKMVLMSNVIFSNQYMNFLS